MTAPTQSIVTFAVTGMHCASCGLLIDDALEDVAGVIRSATDSRAGRTVVTMDASVAALPVVVAAITAAGYNAAPVED